MVYDDWNHYFDTANHEVDTNKSIEGNGSLHVVDAELLSAEIWPESEASNPTEARIESMVFPVSGDTHPIGCFFRFQDADNYYLLTHHPSPGNGVKRNRLYKYVNGTQSNPGTWENTSGYTYSDGSSSAADNWGRWRFDFWEDSGSVRGRISEDLDGDGAFTQVGDDVIDGSPSLGTGGGVGLGCGGIQAFATSIYWDDSEVFY